MRRVLIVGVAIAAALLLAPSCGGGSGSRDTSGDVSLSAPPRANLDGYAWGTAGFSFWAQSSNPGIMVGDLADIEARGFLTFDISLLPPPPAVVRSAVLEIEQWQVTSNPFPGYGSVVIDHVNMNNAYDILDFDSAALDPAFAVVSSTTGQRIISIDVRSQIGADQVDGRANASFRLKFTLPTGLNSNAINDSVNFNDAEDFASSGAIPKLTIVYTP